MQLQRKKPRYIKTRTQEGISQIGMTYFNKEPKRVNLNQKKDQRNAPK